MSEKHILQTILTLSKSLIILYTNGEIESANKNVKKLMNDNLNKSLELQFKLYKKMEKNNYYQISNIDSNTINTTFQKLKMTYF